MFGRKKKQAPPAFDLRGKRPAVRSSICTGERTAGFKDLKTGRFQEVMLIRNSGDLQEFLTRYGLSEEDVGQEW